MILATMLTQQTAAHNLVMLLFFITSNQRNKLNKNQLIHYGLFNVVMNISVSEFQIDVNGDLSRLEISFKVE